MTILVYSLTDVFYYSFYIEGFYRAYGKRNVIFSCEEFPKFPDRTFAAIIKDQGREKRIIIDAFDSDRVAQNQLEWCDVYGKVNFRSKRLSGEGQQNKIIAIGPSFGIRVWSLRETLGLALSNYKKSKDLVYFKRHFFANYWRQFKRKRIKHYLREPDVVNGYVFFLSSLWVKEERTNYYRASFIRACKNAGNIKFEGGFAPRSDGKDLGYQDLIVKKVGLNEYLQKIKKSFVVFNTPAVEDCLGWKLGEFLAIGKAIISTDIYNDLPYPLNHGEHIHHVSDEMEEIENALDTILTDQEYRKTLERNAQQYFIHHLLPEVVVKNLVEE